MQSLFLQNGKETPEPVKAHVQGHLPTWLQGTLMRNGPALFSVGDVFYRSKFLKSQTYKKNMKEGRIVVSEFGTMVYPDPCKNIFSRAMTHLSNIIPDFTDNNMINIIRYGQDYYASSEINYMTQIDPASLETIGRINYRNHISINLATAHPHYDDEGNTYNMGTAIVGLGPPKYVIFKVPADGSGSEKKEGALRQVQQICSLPFRSTLSPSYFHSFGLTENFIVFVEQPFKVNIAKLATAYFRGINWGSCLNFDKDASTFFHLFHRRTGKRVSTSFYGDPLVVFHHINAYETEEHVVFDLIAYQDSNLYDMFYMKNLRLNAESFIEANANASPPVSQRFVLPLHVTKDSPKESNLVNLADTTATAVMKDDGQVYCQPQMLFLGLELPNINYKLNGKKYRYFYGSKVDWSTQPNKIIKVDTVAKTHLEWHQDNCYPSEPVFVASPGAVDEDDGVILSSVISPDPNTSPFMLVLDAKTLTEQARANIPANVHLDLHGLFIPSDN